MNERFGESLGKITAQNWPAYDEAKLVETETDIIVQVNGKVRDKFRAGLDASDEELKTAALALAKIQQLVAGKEIRRVVVVQNKLVNIVIGS